MAIIKFSADFSYLDDEWSTCSNYDNVIIDKGPATQVDTMCRTHKVHTTACRASDKKETI